MEPMDIAVARKFKNLALNLSHSGQAVSSWEALLDVLESGDFTDPEAVLTMLQQAANVVRAREHLKVFEGRLAQLIARAERAQCD